MVEARAGQKVEAPSVPVAFYSVAAELAFCERRSAMWTEIFYRVELAAHVVKRKLRSAGKLYGCPAPFRDIFNATDGDDLPGTFGLSEVIESGLEGFHHKNRNAGARAVANQRRKKPALFAFFYLRALLA